MSSRKEALQGLLSSLRHVSDDPATDAALSTEQLQNLSEQISEILGDDANRGSAPEDQTSQLRNEDGDPIIDISESVDEDQTNTASSPVLEQGLIPLTLLPPEEKARRRRDRDRILDLLEEEERLQQLQEDRDAEEERMEAIRKRRESSKAELEQLRATQELQKKMGQALVRHTTGLGERKQEDARSRPRDASPVAKKTVSFADVVAVTADEKDRQASIPHSDWGDVTLGRLRAPARVPLVSTADAQKYPMKMHVVERHPTTITNSASRNDGDSDDESLSTDSSHVQTISSNDENESSSSNDDLQDDECLEEEFDYDVAQHHREIALEYHKKRHVIGHETAKAMAMHSLDDYDPDETPRGHWPLSHSQADRMAAVYNESHGPIDPTERTIDPASRQKSLRKSMRLGKLENDQLVGGDSGESGSEDETIREVTRMLQTGGFENLGPGSSTSPMSTFTTHQIPDVPGPPTIRPLTANRGLKPSRFNLARGGKRDTIRGDESRENIRLQSAISSVVERKASRSSSGQHFRINKTPPRSLVEAAEPVPDPVIIDSPSFPILSSSSAGIPSSSSACPTTVGFHQTQSDSPRVNGDQSSRYPQDPSSLERPISKFLAERKGGVI